MKRVLIGCERSGVVRSAFRALGFDAWSCDIVPADDGGEHITGNVETILGDRWDLLVIHPPCTYLCSSGLHWNTRPEGIAIDRARRTEEALEFVRRIMAAPIEYIAIENPVGCIGTRIRPADQYFHPYQFGHDASKKTGLWLTNLPHLQPTDFVAPRMVDGKPRWGNQTDSGQNKLGPSEDRATIRSETYSGVAQAMADQWGAWILQNEFRLIP